MILTNKEYKVVETAWTKGNTVCITKDLQVIDQSKLKDSGNIIDSVSSYTCHSLDDMKHKIEARVRVYKNIGGLIS